MESKFAVLCSRYHVYKNLWDVSVGDELPWEWYAVAVMRRSAIVIGHEPRNCLLAISGRSVTEVQ